VSSSVAWARGLAFATPLALLGGALIGEHAFGLVACEMCWWQRYPHMAALLAAGLAFALTEPRTVRWLTAIAGGGLLTTAGIAAWHVGVEQRWLPTPACSAGGGSLAEILARPPVACDQVQWSLGGVSLAGFNLAFSLAAGITVFALLLARRTTPVARAPKGLPA